MRSLVDRNGNPLSSNGTPAARSVGATISPHYTGKPQWVVRTPESMRREGMEKIALIFRCIQYTANMAGQSGVTLRIYDYAPDGSRKAIDDHPLRLLMKRPNPQMREGRFLSFITMVATTVNFCVIEKVRSAAGRVVALEPLNSEWIVPILRDQGPPDWEYRIPGIGKPYVLPSSEVLTFTYADRPNYRMDPLGTGPVEACFREIGLLNVLTNFLKVFFDRGAMPVYGALVESFPGASPMTQSEKDMLTEGFIARHGGLDKAAVPVILEGIKDIKRLSFDFDELALTDIRDMSDIAICQAFGIDPSTIATRVGMEHSDARANAVEANRKFYRDTMIPLWNRIDETLTLNLLPDFEAMPTTRDLEFDYSEVQALQEDRNTKATWLGTAFAQGSISQHRYFEEMGLPLPTTPDFYLRGLNMQAIPVDDPLGIAAQEAADKKAEDAIRAAEARAAAAAAKTADHADPADPEAPPDKVPPKKSADEPLAGDMPRLIFGRTKFGADGESEIEIVHPGLFVGMFLPAEQAMQLAIEGGEPAESLHLTLVYDSNAILDDLGWAHVVAAIDNACGESRPLLGSVAGHGRFYSGDGTTDVFYAVPNLPGLGELRDDLCDALCEIGIEAGESEGHSFNPHVTLAYIESSAPDPVDQVVAIELSLGAITVSYGDETVVIPLRGGMGDPMDRMTSFGPTVSLVGVPPSEQYAVRKKIGASNRAMVNRIANVGTKLLATFFRQQAARVIKAATSPAGVAHYSRIAEAARPVLLSERSIDELIAIKGPSSALMVADVNWPYEEKELGKQLEKIHSLAGDTAAANVTAQVGVAISWDLANPNVRDVMGRLSQRVVGINQTSRDLISEAVTKAAEEGKSASELADDLRSMFGDWSKSRAETVARSESMTSYGYASAAGYRMTDVVDRIQCFDNPDHTDDYLKGDGDGLSCAERDGYIDELDSADLHIDSEHPNGSLTISPVLKGAE